MRSTCVSLLLTLAASSTALAEDGAGARSSFSPRGGGSVELQVTGQTVEGLGFSWDAAAGVGTWTIARSKEGEAEEQTFKSEIKQVNTVRAVPVTYRQGRRNYTSYQNQTVSEKTATLPAEEKTLVCGIAKGGCKTYPVYYIHPTDAVPIWSSKHGDRYVSAGATALGPADLKDENENALTYLPLHHPDPGSLYLVAKKQRQKTGRYEERTKTQYWNDNEQYWDVQNHTRNTGQLGVAVNQYGQITGIGEIQLQWQTQQLRTRSIPRSRDYKVNEWVWDDPYLGDIWTTEKPQ